jgi:hypothetical protein
VFGIIRDGDAYFRNDDFGGSRGEGASIESNNLVRKLLLSFRKAVKNRA